MELHEAHELKEVFGATAASEAIQNDGWTLLSVTSATYFSDPFNDRAGKLCPCYILGKRKKATASTSNLRI